MELILTILDELAPRSFLRASTWRARRRSKTFAFAAQGLTASLRLRSESRP